MNPRARRKRHLLRISREKKIRTEPVYGEDGSILHYRWVHHQDYVRRYGIWSAKTARRDENGRIVFTSKAAQQMLKEVRLYARWDAEHATSDCCGWGNGEVYHDPYHYTGTDLVPRRNRLYPEPTDQ